MVAAPQALAESTVYGQVYDWSTFDMINHSIVVVNTVPGQKVVTTNGSYILKIPPGNYTISATSGYGAGALYGYENITLSGTGEYKIDLLLFPDTNLTALEILGRQLPSPVPTAPVVTDNQQPGSDAPVNPGQPQDSLLPAAIGFTVLAAIILSLIAGFWLTRKKKSQAALDRQDTMDEPDQTQPQMDNHDQTGEPAGQEQQDTGETAPEIVTPPARHPHVKPPWERVLRPDCKSVIATIEKNGGRITQLDLRKALPYSEAKISLIISELEDAGYLKKIKRGRGNVLILNCHEGYGTDRPPE